MGHQINFHNRWDFQRKNGEGVSGYSIMSDKRKGGQVRFHDKYDNKSVINADEELDLL